MAYEIVTVEGVVVGVKNYGEQNRELYIFNSTGSIVVAHVQSGRHSRKLSPASQWLQYGAFDVLVGRKLRLLGFSPFEYPFDKLDLSIAQYQYYAQCCAYVLRFVQGEAVDANSYDTFLEFFSLIVVDESVVSRYVTGFQYAFLCALGYGDYSSIATYDQQVQLVRSMEQRSHL